MKAINELELDDIIDKTSPLVGGYIQSVICFPSALILEIYTNKKNYILFDLTPSCPFFAVFENSILQKSKKVTKPMQLFINSNFLGGKLLRVQRDKNLGRVIIFDFMVDSKSARLEFRCIPHGQNLIATVEEKKISWAKVTNISLQQDKHYQPKDVRSYEDILNQWLTKTKQQSVQNTSLDKNKALIKKKTNLLAKLGDELLEKKNNPWQELIDELVERNSLQVNENLTDLINHKKDLSWNLQNSYNQKKIWDKKTQQLELRMQQIKEEIEKIKSGQFVDSEITQKQKLKPKGIKAKSFDLGDNLIVFLGRSAKENLQILRQAKAWDYWLHLKDYPGSYGIIHRQKNQNVPEAALIQAAMWVAKMTFGAKAQTKKGEKLDVLIAECRYVRPIKGDKLGRANYQNERVMSLIFKGN